MLEMRLFRDNPEMIRADHDRRGLPHDMIDQVIDLDNRWKDLRYQVDQLRKKRNEAARGIAAAKKSGATASKTSAPSAKDAEKAATKLLAKKSTPKAKTGEKIDRTTKRQYTRDEKKKMVRAGKRLEKDLRKGVDRPASHYQP